MRREVADTRQTASTWITETRCMGLCPDTGATVAIYPGPGVFLSDGSVENIRVELERASRMARAASSGDEDAQPEREEAVTSPASSLPRKP